MRMFPKIINKEEGFKKKKYFKILRNKATLYQNNFLYMQIFQAHLIGINVKAC